MVSRKAFYVLVLVLCLLPQVPASGQELDVADLKAMIAAYKEDPRGPFQSIRWFCPDGSVLPPQERCAQPGGKQHALHNDEVIELGKTHNIWLGQILTGTPYDEFLDREHFFERLKQYQLEKFLQGADDGWILRRARYYRGAYQAEDEEAWSLGFLKWVLAQDDLLKEYFFIVRQITRELPQVDNDDAALQVRSISKNIGDELPSFMDIRVKIHNQPEASDLQWVRQYREQQGEAIPAELQDDFDTLEKQLELVYQQTDIQNLADYSQAFPRGTPVGLQLSVLLEDDRSMQVSQNGMDASTIARRRTANIADLIWVVRQDLELKHAPMQRYQLLRLSLDLEAILFRIIGDWEPRSLGEILEKAYYLAKAVAGSGYIEVWEWDVIEPQLGLVLFTRELNIKQLLDQVTTARSVVEWSTGMFRAHYDPVINRFATFEPLATGFLDDRIRASILLPFGDCVSLVADYAHKLAGFSSRVMDIAEQGQIHGLNPGFAVGELEVITGPPEEVNFVDNRIYMMLRPPLDMKPVAGIGTVTEGNAVSHVQLLARNLGIPNAVISASLLEKLRRFSGRRVFYAVSPRGTVVLKPAEEMTAIEQKLVAESKQRTDKIEVGTDRLDLRKRDIISLDDLRAEDSGRVCGPKAANLGQLKVYFPRQVAPGLVIPFGVFRAHLEQQMTEGGATYWQYLQRTFKDAEAVRMRGEDERKAQAITLARLSHLRTAIQSIRFLPGFIDELKKRFEQEFEVQMGQLPVFIRSDTNMEDLKEFTGAGLNLTVFNIRAEQAIERAIRNVWASPFTERSFRWRQSFLLNPENVFPSLLILPSVRVEKSGVMITTGVMSGNPREVTVAMNKGGGGAVEGQASETYILQPDGTDVLISPSRTLLATYLPVEGGIARRMVTFSKPILSNSERLQLRKMAIEMRKILPDTPGIESDGPFDIELGFTDGALWLFQVRPFVENRRALSSTYLVAMDPKVEMSRVINLSTKL